MASHSIQFKKMFVRHTPLDRANIINALSSWTNGITSDQKIHMFQNFLAQLQGFVSLPKKELEDHAWVWSLANSLNDCVSFQEVVKNKLAIPKKNIDKVIQQKTAPPRKSIPKKIRETIWKRDCGDSVSGKCFCCSQGVSALGEWHAGHILAQCNGGADTPDNLRVVCVACNLAMATENMDEFKKRCYPNT
jgi:hypothetical protein